MNQELNGAAKHSGEPTLAELKEHWAIVTAGAERLVGRVVNTVGSRDLPDSMLLSPGYVVVGGFSPQVTPQGQVLGLGFMSMLASEEMAIGSYSMAVRPNRVRYLADFDPDDFADKAAQILECVRQVQAMRVQRRASRLNLTLPGPGMNLPPMPRAK